MMSPKKIGLSPQESSKELLYVNFENLLFFRRQNCWKPEFSILLKNVSGALMLMPQRLPTALTLSPNKISCYATDT